MQERINETIEWINKVVTTSDRSGIVLGLSGGIDSAVLCGLCVKAVKPENVLAVLLPCYSCEQDKVDALVVADVFKVRTKTVDISVAFDSLIEKTMIPTNKVSSGNMKARLRMVTQYYIANQLNYLVAGSDDRSESYIGYFTKYGDGASDFAPLANYTKTEVRKIASLIGVPQYIIDKPSTPGLWDGQTAEDELGITYNDVDTYLSNGYLDDNTKGLIEQKHAMTEHKRIMPVTMRSV